MSLFLRAELVLSRYGVAVAVALSLVGLLAVGGAVATYTNPPTEEVTRTVDEQSVATGANTSAVVTGPTSLYESGETLRNSPAYLFNATPSLTVTVDTDVPEDEEVTVSHRLVLHHEATRDGEAFWESTRVLAADQSTVTDGRVRTDAAVNMSSVRERLADRRTEVGAVGAFTTTLRLEVRYDTGQYSDELVGTAPVTLTQRAYWVDGSLAANRTHEETVTRTVTGSPPMGQVLGAALAALAAFGLAAGSVWLYLRDTDVEAVRTAIARSRYDEWISRGEIPTRSEKEYIRIDTLEDLVDIAIDSSKRVIHDEGYDVYGVVDGDEVYYFGPEGSEFGRWAGV
jgi:hypothetical protein